MENERKRLLAYVTFENDCWIFGGSQARNGYGRFYFRGKSWLAHRAAYVLWIGKISAGMDICHKCDVRNCINPNHLFEGTRSDNMRDCASKGRTKFSLHNKKKTHCNRGHEYTPENTWINKIGWRWCKECNRIKGNKRYHGNKNSAPAKTEAI